MKTLFLYIVQISMFCSYTCIFGIPQPRPDHGKLSKWTSGENINKICQEVNGDIENKSFLDQDTVLCFGVKVFSQQFDGGVEPIAVLDGVEKKPVTDICKYFQEMRLNSNLEKSNGSAVIYNKQFEDKNKCEKVCVDVMENVNPLCRMILSLSRQSSRGYPVGSGIQTPSTTLPSDVAENDNNEVSGQPRKNLKNFTSRIPDEQKPKVSDVGQVINEGHSINEQMTVIHDQKQISKGQKLDGEDKSSVQKTESAPPEQIPEGIKSLLPADVANVERQTQQSSVIKTAPDEEKSKATSEVKKNFGERVNDGPARSGVSEDKINTTPNNDTGTDITKKTANSMKEPKGSIVKDTSSVTKNENEGKSDALLKEKQMGPSSVVLPESSGNDKNEPVVVPRPKLPENTNIVETSITSNKVLTDTALQKEESISQVSSVKGGQDDVKGEKSQADNKETEKPPQKEAELETNNKKNTEVIAKTNTDEQKTNQNNEKAYTNEDVETAPQLDQVDTQRTVNEEIHFTDDTSDGVAELDTHFSVETGESNDNTEFTSGGGTGVDYARPGSDVIETDNNDLDAGRVVIHEKYEEDDSHFFAYFMTTMVFCIVGYLLFHNKQKILALALEGRARRGRRRPNTSGYRKLDSNLEEAISSSKSASVTQVIY